MSAPHTRCTSATSVRDSVYLYSVAADHVSAMYSGRQPLSRRNTNYDRQRRDGGRRQRCLVVG